MRPDPSHRRVLQLEAPFMPPRAPRALVLTTALGSYSRLPSAAVIDRLWQLPRERAAAAEHGCDRRQGEAPFFLIPQAHRSLADCRRPLDPNDQATEKLVSEFNYLRMNAVQPLAKFLDYMTCVPRPPEAARRTEISEPALKLPDP